MFKELINIEWLRSLNSSSSIVYTIIELMRSLIIKEVFEWYSPAEFLNLVVWFVNGTDWKPRIEHC